MNENKKSYFKMFDHRTYLKIPNKGLFDPLMVLSIKHTVCYIRSDKLIERYVCQHSQYSNLILKPLNFSFKEKEMFLNKIQIHYQEVNPIIRIVRIN